MSNPEDLTKVQLKEELVAHGVKLPPGQALKSVYVELYNSHISKDSGEFSSDDNVVQVQRSSSSKRSKRIANMVATGLLPVDENGGIYTSPGDEEHHDVQVYVKPEKSNSSRRKYKGRMPSFLTGDGGVEPVIMMEKIDTTLDKKKVISNSTSDLESLEHLTNAEITAKLKELGQYTGPVIATTRKVYLKRLKEVLQENVTDDHTEYSDEESVPKVPVTRSSSKRRTMMELSENPPLVSRKSQSCTSRIAQSLHVPVVQSSSCNMPIQRSFARKPDFEITDSPKSIASATRRRPLRTTALKDRKEEIPKIAQEINKTELVEEPTKIVTQQKSELAKVKTVKPERRWISVWVQVIITAALVLFIYLVVQTMESNPKAPSLPNP
ncbi:uncharacterized protein LOC143460367 isoform X1 [Clavelina lepadiformis]|uniref:uncharacterized protein LOC143460367 isoform X1 n=1 Tax=Clavelina lepadiformis TaxID=159417 RepID=UPI004043232B